MKRDWCEQCGESYLGSRSDQKYCSKECSRKATKAASRAAKLAAPDRGTPLQRQEWPYDDDEAEPELPELGLAVTTTEFLTAGWPQQTDPDAPDPNEFVWGAW